MRSIKLAKLQPFQTTPGQLRAWMGRDLNIRQGGQPGMFAAYGDASMSISDIEARLRAMAQKKNLILITGASGIGKNEFMGKKFIQFALKVKPSKKPGPPTVQPTAVPSRIQPPPANVPGQTATVTPNGNVELQKKNRGFIAKNRLGWTKDGFTAFYRLTKPGSIWTNVKKNFANPVEQNSVIEDTATLHSLFSGPAKYQPLAQMFGQLGALLSKIHFDHDEWQRQYGHDGNNFASRDKSEYIAQVKQLIPRIQDRFERLYDFARREALAKSIVIKSIGNRRLI